MNEILRTERLNKAFHLGETIYAVSDVSISIPAGKITAIVGPSGCGKSTLLRCINLLERPNSGRILLGGRDLRSLSFAQIRSLISVPATSSARMHSTALKATPSMTARTMSPAPCDEERPRKAPLASGRR